MCSHSYPFSALRDDPHRLEASNCEIGTIVPIPERAFRSAAAYFAAVVGSSMDVCGVQRAVGSVEIVESTINSVTASAMHEPSSKVAAASKLTVVYTCQRARMGTDITELKRGDGRESSKR